jgi:hypothetical protein
MEIADGFEKEDRLMEQVEGRDSGEERDEIGKYGVEIHVVGRSFQEGSEKTSDESLWIHGR